VSWNFSAGKFFFFSLLDPQQRKKFSLRIKWKRFYPGRQINKLAELYVPTVAWRACRVQRDRYAELFGCFSNSTTSAVQATIESFSRHCRETTPQYIGDGYKQDEKNIQRSAGWTSCWRASQLAGSGHSSWWAKSWIFSRDWPLQRAAGFNECLRSSFPARSSLVKKQAASLEFVAVA